MRRSWRTRSWTLELQRPRCLSKVHRVARAVRRLRTALIRRALFRPQSRAGLPGGRWPYRPERKLRRATEVFRARRAAHARSAAAPGFAQPPGLSYRVPDAAPSLQSSAFPSVPAAPPPAASSSGGGGFFSLKPYAVYFDVDTADVLHRMRLACVPFGSSFMTTVQDKPDL